MTDRQVARDISYAGSVRSRGGQALVRMLENVTGRIGLIRWIGCSGGLRSFGVFRQRLVVGLHHILESFWHFFLQALGNILTNLA